MVRREGIEAFCWLGQLSLIHATAIRCGSDRYFTLGTCSGDIGDKLFTLDDNMTVRNTYGRD